MVIGHEETGRILHEAASRCLQSCLARQSVHKRDSHGSCGCFFQAECKHLGLQGGSRTICSQPAPPGDEEGGQANTPKERQPCSHKEQKEQNKAHDAIIVAIGIVAVLIANVAYVGYLSTPGGPNP